MRKTKLIAVAAGFLAAAGLASAGKIFVNGSEVGTYNDVRINGNGAIQINSSDFNPDGGGGGGDTLNCGNFASPSNGSCVCWGGYEHEGGDTAPEGADCTLVDSGGGGGDTGGDTGGTPANCTGVGTSWARDTSRTGFLTFPLPSGNWEKFTIDKNHYMAIKFNSGSDNQGKVSFDRHTHAEDTVKTVAISRCPGDFAETVSSSLCSRTNQALAVYFNTGAPFKSWECQLEPNTEYYLNIAYGKSSSGNNKLENTCTKSRCGAVYAFYH